MIIPLLSLLLPPLCWLCRSPSPKGISLHHFLKTMPSVTDACWWPSCWSSGAPGGSPPSMVALPRRGHGSQQGQGNSCCFASSGRGPALGRFGWSTTAHPRTHSYTSRLGPCFLGVKRSMKKACAITCSKKSCVKTPWNLSATTVTKKAKRNDYFSKKWLRSQQRVSFPNQTVLT